MKPIEWARMITAERRFIKREMKVQGLEPTGLAALSNLGVVTVFNYLNERTFSPHHRTVMSLFHGLGYEIALPDGNRTIRMQESKKTSKRRRRSG